MKEEGILSHSHYSNDDVLRKHHAHIRIKLVGNLGKTKEGKRVEVELAEAPRKLGEILKDLEVKYGIELRRDSILVLVNGIEANALDDLDTIVSEEGEVVILPMFHGG